MSVLLEDHVPPTVFMGTVICMDYTHKIIVVNFAVPMKVTVGLDLSLVLILTCGDPLMLLQIQKSFSAEQLRRQSTSVFVVWQ